MKLNHTALQQAEGLIQRRQAVSDERDAWRKHRPTSRDQNAYIRAHGIREYANWFLGIDDQAAEDTKARHRFPYGDFENVHRCAVLSTEVSAGRYRYSAVEAAAAHLHGMLDRLT
jgi:hypothetical protein